MVSEAKQPGLIVATSREATPALGELIQHSGWPALLQATPQRLRRELLLAIPELSLFWLDDEDELSATADLIAWLAAQEPAVKRVAVGYHLPEHVELAVRSAGASIYLPANGNLRDLIKSAIVPQVGRPSYQAAKHRATPLAIKLPPVLPESTEANFHATGPP